MFVENLYALGNKITSSFGEDYNNEFGKASGVQRNFSYNKRTVATTRIKSGRKRSVMRKSPWN